MCSAMQVCNIFYFNMCCSDNNALILNYLAYADWAHNKQ
jgi:hypothetical protein